MVSVRMGQAPPPDSGKVPLAKKNTLAANKAQWGIESVPPSPQSPSVATPVAAAAPAPKKAAAPAPAAAAAGATVGFSGVPANFNRPGPSAFGASTGQTFLGMGGPRAPGHREKFGGRHAAISLATAAFLFQPILQAGNYNLPATPGAPYTKASFDSTLAKAGFEGKTVPTLDAFFPFAKNGFTPGPALFSAESPLVFEKDILGGCGAYNNKAGSCHTFFDEIGDALSKKQEAAPRADKQGGFFLPWVWKK